MEVLCEKTDCLHQRGHKCHRSFIVIAITGMCDSFTIKVGQEAGNVDGGSTEDYPLCPCCGLE